MGPSHIYLHRSRFVDYTPASITALAFSHPNLSKSSPIPASLRLAIGRSNGDIEIWNPLKGLWYHESTLKGGKGRSIEGLAWIQDTPGDGSQLRLFSIGYSSVVTEWDLETGRPRKHVDCNGGVIWSIAAQPRVLGGKAQDGEELRQDLVVGLDDGSVTLLSTDGGPGLLEYSKTLMKSSSTRARVLCLAWQSRYTVVAGMADSTIRVWDIRNGRMLTRMTLGKDHKKRGSPREALIWAVKVLRNGDIVSGNSRGEVMFWDGKTYSLRQRIKAHEADVLTLDVNRAGDMVVASGVDRKTVFFGLQKGGQNKGRWAELFGRRIHSHDVRAIAAWEGGSMSTIVSGGVDMSPIITPFANFLNANHRTLHAIPQKPIVTGISGSRLLMSWYDREVKIWAIDKLENVTGVVLRPGLENTGRRLVSRLVLGNEENITSAHFASMIGSNSGYILAISTNAEVKLFHLRPPKPRTLSYALRVSKIEIPESFRARKDPKGGLDSMDEDSSDESDDENEEISLTQDGARIVQFSPDGKWLLVITPESRVMIVPVNVTETIMEKRSKVSVSLNPEVFILDRIPRALPHEIARQAQAQKQQQTPSKKKNFDYGNLGSYSHTIIRVAFSSNSRILMVTDLSGNLDSYVLQDGRWIVNIAGRLLPKLEYPVAAMEFRPASSRQTARSPAQPLLQGAPANDSEDEEPTQTTSDSDPQEDRLMILSSHGQAIFEFHVLKGRLTEWSRRNPPSKFPKDFRKVVDLGCGIVWEIEEDNVPPAGGECIFTKERVWFWGPNWIWMFDLQHDLPDPNTFSSTPNSLIKTQLHKRKRGAAGMVTGSGKLGGSTLQSHTDDGDGDVAMLDENEDDHVTHTDDDDDAFHKDENDSEDDDDNDISTGSHWGKFSRTLGTKSNTTSASKEVDVDALEPINVAKSTVKPYVRHYKYRPIMALMPIGEWGPPGAATTTTTTTTNGIATTTEKTSQQETQKYKELVIVERPVWDIELPPRFYGKKERTDELSRGLWG